MVALSFPPPHVGRSSNSSGAPCTARGSPRHARDRPRGRADPATSTRPIAGRRCAGSPGALRRATRATRGPPRTAPPARHATGAQMLEHRSRGFAERRQRLDQRPERDPLAVVQAATAQHGRRVPTRPAAQRPAATYPHRHAQQREQMTTGSATVRSHAAPARPAHVRGQQAARRDERAKPAPRDRGARAETRHRLDLPFIASGLERLDLDRVTDQAQGVFAEQNLTRGAGAAQAAPRRSPLADARDLALAASTRPVLTAVRKLSATPASATRAGSRVTDLSRARTARSASSSRDRGTPEYRPSPRRP